MNIRIKRDKVIHFNSVKVYFLKNNLVYRGDRRVTKNTGVSCRESSNDLYIAKGTVKRMEFFEPGRSVCMERTAEVLKRHGVKIIKGKLREPKLLVPNPLEMEK